MEDLIISPGSELSCVIVCAGGFFGTGTSNRTGPHDVASLVLQVKDDGVKRVQPGATEHPRKGPSADATDTARSEGFVLAADRRIAKGEAAVARVEITAGAANSRANIDADMTVLQSDLKSAEPGLYVICADWPLRH
ncbi:hypothetical protein [Methyloversatilis sp. XJ19-49]|uniref:hypothetical protein n=1 Tax=Methyloversatilis sp. XJ19-49 TaxID=2963429 RepID=UPI00211B81B0|nr:hypothetical protein [Methyloversatilis sp. XJ19-49]MCQ9376950.1 hypothetical protein [Methyloversatilis sp. XJ19-49]